MGRSIPERRVPLGALGRGHVIPTWAFAWGGVCCISPSEVVIFPFDEDIDEYLRQML